MGSKSNQSEFIVHLRTEKFNTQDARTKYVIRKLVFATALLGIGTINVERFNFSFPLYLLPYVTIAFDLYILGEDYSVKRIGAFLGANSTENLEQKWENWVSRNRDPFAPFSMPFLTTLVTFASAIGIWFNGSEIDTYFWMWLTLALIISWILFIYYIFYLRRRLSKRLKELEEK